MQPTFEIRELLNESGWLRGLAASLVGDPALADDLVQDTWLAALRHPPRAGRDARPWLARVVHNLARNTRRDGARRAAREEFAHEERFESNPEALAEVAEAQRFLAEAVTCLPEELRAVIVLCYFQGLDSSRAGERLDLSASAVRTRLQAALTALRADLDRRTPGGREAWAGILAGLARTSAGAVGTAAAAAVTESALLGPWALALVAGAAAVGLAVIVVRGERRNESEGERITLGTPGTPYARGTTGAAEPARPAQPYRASEPELEADAREVLPLDSNVQPKAAPAPAQVAARISGTIRVDGRPPEWPLAVSLAPTLPPADPDGRRA
ncbi:MAG: RNA polymerase sigma factor, partial [Planctomycetes bacterium]|nr:RNA polymerase sigma factor [Planctomycetota bacterium]